VKKLDLYLASAMCIIALVWFLIEYFFSVNGQLVNIYVDNEIVCSYELKVNGTYEISNDGAVIATLIIKNGYADITDANCKDKFCVYQNPISKDGETIVCLPNKLVVKVEGNSTDDNTDNNVDNNEVSKDNYDAIAY